MNLATRCPTCGTSFRVLPAQLSARGGKVRCGQCSSVFDGVASLVAEAPAPPDGAAPGEPSPQLALFEPSRRTQVAASGSAANEDVPLVDFLEEAPKPRRRFIWAVGSLLGLVALAAQAAFHLRTEIAVLVPESRAYLAAACARLGCELRLPRRPKLMAIESSDLQADGRRDNVIVLNALLRNQAPFAQEYPALELTLTNERDEAVARRVLLPRDYLAGTAPERVEQGISAGSEATLRIYFDTTSLRAVGYRLYLFFP